MPTHGLASNQHFSLYLILWVVNFFLFLCIFYFTSFWGIKCNIWLKKSLFVFFCFVVLPPPKAMGCWRRLRACVCRCAWVGFDSFRGAICALFAPRVLKPWRVRQCFRSREIQHCGASFGRWRCWIFSCASLSERPCIGNLKPPPSRRCVFGRARFVADSDAHVCDHGG